MHPGPSDGNVWRKTQIEPWTKWFAWRPVKIQGRRVWFKTVYRRAIWHYGGDNGEWCSWEYGNLFDVLKHSQ